MSDILTREQLPEFEDADVQVVYELLCDTETRPPIEEHWEGFVARRIVARQRAEIAAMQEALAKAGHAEDCGHFNSICSACRKDHSNFPNPPTPNCPEPYEWLDGECNCYLSTLSDAVERGKKLLGMGAENERLRKALEFVADHRDVLGDAASDLVTIRLRALAALSGSRPSGEGEKA